MNDREIEPLPVRMPGSLLSLMRELGELKRVRSAGRVGSIAARWFSEGWARLLSTGSTVDAMRGQVGGALAAVRLGDIDRDVLRDLDVGEAQAASILRDAFDAVAGPIDPSLRAMLSGPHDRAPCMPLPDFVSRLSDQPRAGVTCPGRPRLVFEPTENHAEHCATVAVYGVLLSPVFDADPSTVWLASMAHHFHNAYLPDSGFTGEVLLGASLDLAVERATARCLSQLTRDLAALVSDARRILPDASSADARAFHAADTLDRVWQVEQHLRAGRVGLDQVLGEMALIHEGPAKAFQDQVLRAAGLAS